MVVINPHLDDGVPLQFLRLSQACLGQERREDRSTWQVLPLPKSLPTSARREKKIKLLKRRDFNFRALLGAPKTNRALFFNEINFITPPASYHHIFLPQPDAIAYLLCSKSKNSAQASSSSLSPFFTASALISSMNLCHLCTFSPLTWSKTGFFSIVV